MPESRYSELPLSAQTAYAELAERTRAFEVDNALAGLTGNFHTLKRKGNTYWYFSYREPGVVRSSVVHIGPDTGQSARPGGALSRPALAQGVGAPGARLS